MTTAHPTRPEQDTDDEANTSETAEQSAPDADTTATEPAATDQEGTDHEGAGSETSESTESGTTTETTDDEPDDTTDSGEAGQRTTTRTAVVKRRVRALLSPLRRIPWRRPVSWLTVLCILLLAGTVVSGLGWLRTHNSATQQNELRGSALHAAREYAVDLTTYDYQHLDEQRETLNSESTDNFQETFQESNESLQPIFNRLEASAEGEVADAAVRDVSDSGAVVLLFVNQIADSTKLDEPQNQASRLRMQLVRDDDTWLLDNVDLVP